jgi:acyl-coenzyme A synthetase/AMP-(fatty) acid ligase
MMICPLPSVTDLKPGSASRPMFGVQPALFDADGNELEGAVDGNLVIKDSWPSQARTVYGDINVLSKHTSVLMKEFTLRGMAQGVMKTIIFGLLAELMMCLMCQATDLVQLK